MIQKDSTATLRSPNPMHQAMNEMNSAKKEEINLKKERSQPESQKV